MSKSPSLPAIVVANDLLIGDVVFLGKSTWERDHRHAAIARDQSTAEVLLDRARIDIAANRVVDAYLVTVEIDLDGIPIPLHYREKMRALGPTVRPDLGKQAGL